MNMVNIGQFPGKPQPSKLHGSITKVLLVDVDATLMVNDCEPRLKFGEFGQMVEGAADCLRELSAAGWFISIYTTRKASRELIEWLRFNGATWDTVNSNEHNRHDGSFKPECGVMFDDRAWPMCGKQWTPEVWRAATDGLLSAG